MFPIPRPEPSGWRRWVIGSLDLLYPPQCAICQGRLEGGRALCDACHKNLPRLAEPFCENCGEPFDGQIDGPFTCPNCRGLKLSFEFARAATVRDPRTLDMIHRLKYARELHLAGELGKLAAEAFADPRLATALAEKWPLVPVPLHPQRQRTRTFNQAAELARVLSSHTGLPVLHALRRVRDTVHQTSLTRSKRLENLRGAFQLSKAGHATLATSSPAGVVLVDDVLTTGSTIDECARTLRRAGLPRIVAVTVMRG